ncbi:MAG: universal stress protein [Myxococcales bacterium]
MAFEHILVATDFSEHSERALDVCRKLAVEGGSKVSLVHVYPETFYAAYPVPAAPVAPSKQQLAEMKQAIEESLERLRGERLEGVSFAHVGLISHDSPAQAVCEYAGEHGVDLIIVGSHGRTGLAKFLMGSVAEQIARHAGCSVLLAR